MPFFSHRSAVSAYRDDPGSFSSSSSAPVFIPFLSFSLEYRAQPSSSSSSSPLSFSLLLSRNGSNQDRGCQPLPLLALLLPHGSRRYYAKYFLLRGTGREYFMRCIIWPDVPSFREIYHHSSLPRKRDFILKGIIAFPWCTRMRSERIYICIMKPKINNAKTCLKLNLQRKLRKINN